MQAEVEAALQHVANKLAEDLWTGSPSRVKIYSDGAPNGEDTWVGICVVCEARHVTNLDPKHYTTMPDACGEANGNFAAASCTGTVLLAADWEALLAAFKIGGWDALRDDSGCGRVVRHSAGDGLHTYNFKVTIE